MHYKLLRILFFAASMVVIIACVSEFIPDIREESELLVVQGLITNQPETYSIRVSRSMPVGVGDTVKPLGGCTVTVIDDSDNRYRFSESDIGTYTSPPEFQGMVGRKYRIHVSARFGSAIQNYASDFIEMLPVPPVSLDYEKVIIKDEEFEQFDEEGCRIFLSTDVSNADFLRWDYSETWTLRLPFSVPNYMCWLHDRSRDIMIRNNAATEGEYYIRQPVVYISNRTDRLKTRYSIEVNQYSLNEDEYNYWSALQTMTEETGGVYDVIPASVRGNIRCIENSDEIVLGYFSVSAKESQRIFIDNEFAGIVDLYKDCITDTVYGDGNIPKIDTTVWVLFDKPRSFPHPRTRILTNQIGCYDCTVRGTKEKPSFWIDE